MIVRWFVLYNIYYKNILNYELKRTNMGIIKIINISSIFIYINIVY